MWVEKATATKAAQPELKLKYLTPGNNCKRLQTNDTLLISPTIQVKELFFPSESPAVLLTVWWSILFNSRGGKEQSHTQPQSVVRRCAHGMTVHVALVNTVSDPNTFRYFPTPPSSTHCWYLPAIIWSKPTGGAFCSWFQFPLHTGGMSALKSLIEMDWVIQLTPTRLGVHCAAGAIALGDCNKSLSRHRNSTPVLAVFIKPNWVERCHSLHIFLFFFYHQQCWCLQAVDLNT